MTVGAEQLKSELKNHGIENVVICNNGVSKDSIESDAENLSDLTKEWQDRGHKVIVVGYSRGGSVAICAQTEKGMNASGIVTLEAPIKGAPAWVLKALGFDMSLRGVKDMVRGSPSNNKLLQAIGEGSNLPPMLEISGIVGWTVAGKHGLDIFTPIGGNIYTPWKLIHAGKGWLEPDAIDAMIEFIKSLGEQSSRAVYFLLSRAEDRVSSSAYSSSPPRGRPRPNLVIFLFKGFKVLSKY